MVKVFKPIKPFERIQEQTLGKVDFLQALINYGSLIVKQGFATGVQVKTLYTVPSKKIFFLTSALLGYTTHGTVTTLADALFKFGSQTEPNGFSIDPIDLTNQSQIINLTFSNPIKLKKSDVISCESQDASLNAFMWIFGYEIDEALVPLFF